MQDHRSADPSAAASTTDAHDARPTRARAARFALALVVVDEPCGGSGAGAALVPPAPAPALALALGLALGPALLVLLAPAAATTPPPRNAPPSSCAVDTGVQPCARIAGYVSANARAVSSVSSCSRTMSPGRLGPAGARVGGQGPGAAAGRRRGTHRRTTR